MHRLFVMSIIIVIIIGHCFEVLALISDTSQECLDCHSVFHPGIVSGWEKSRHAQTTIKEAFSVKGLSRKVSSKEVPASLAASSVGCAECHMLNKKSHRDTFEHNGFDIHVVVSPKDCAVCHAQEAEEFTQNLMSHAYANLADNPLYQELQRSIIGTPVLGDNHLISFLPENEATRAQACYYCHGTRLEVSGFETRDTDAGELSFPKIDGWPNQGIGRVNLDDSLGSCTACHPRHGFSIEMARKPYTCKECHTGPDVPAYKVYTASKHGNMFSAMNKSWNFESVPWTVGEDFTAPTCATCHISLVTNTDGDMVVKRTHRMNDRLPWRLFGLIYAHPHPISPQVSNIKNKSGIFLPTDLDGTPAAPYLIDAAEQDKRRDNFQRLCLACHDTSWVSGHWAGVLNTIEQTNHATRTATQLLQLAWKDGLAAGLSQQKNPFDEAVEKKWCNIWLFYANTIRFSSAMGGGGDYSVFADGAYQLSNGIQDISDWYHLRRRLRGDQSIIRDE